MKLQDLVKLKPLITMIESGKKLQWRDDKWTDWEDDFILMHNIADFINGYLEVRIKPEPREWYIAIDVGSGRLVGAGESFIIMEEKYLNKCNVIKVREVLE